MDKDVNKMTLFDFPNFLFIITNSKQTKKFYLIGRDCV